MLCVSAFVVRSVVCVVVCCCVVVTAFFSARHTTPDKPHTKHNTNATSHGDGQREREREKKTEKEEREETTRGGRKEEETECKCACELVFLSQTFTCVRNEVLLSRLPATLSFVPFRVSHHSYLRVTAMGMGLSRTWLTQAADSPLSRHPSAHRRKRKKKAFSRALHINVHVGVTLFAL